MKMNFLKTLINSFQNAFLFELGMHSNSFIARY